MEGDDKKRDLEAKGEEDWVGKRSYFNLVIKLRGELRKMMDCDWGDSTNIPFGWICMLLSELGRGRGFASWQDIEKDWARNNRRAQHVLIKKDLNNRLGWGEDVVLLAGWRMKICFWAGLRRGLFLMIGRTLRKKTDNI